MTQIGAHETEPAGAGIIDDVGPVVDRAGLPVAFIDQAGSRDDIETVVAPGPGGGSQDCGGAIRPPRRV